MILPACLVAALLAPGETPPRGTPSIEQFLNLRRATAPYLSPDGRLVAYQVQETDWAADAFTSEIWLAHADTGENRPLTAFKKSSTSPRWSPDGRWLAFLSDRDGKPQVYRTDPRGGAAEPLTRAETGVTRFEWSPDGRSVAFTAADPGPRPDPARKETFGEFEVADAGRARTQLWLIAVPADAPAAPPKAERLTAGESFSVGEFSWSPDGRRIAFSATREPGPASAGTADIYVLDVAARAVRKVVDAPGPDRNPVWSPDGRQLAYETTNGRESYFTCNQSIAVVPAEGGTPRVLTGALDERAYLIGWGPAGLYFWALQRTDCHLFRLDPASGAVEQLSRPQHALFWHFSLRRDGRQVAFVAASATAYGEVAVSDVPGFAPKTLTRLGEQLRPFRLAARELVAWTSADGTPVEGVLVKPPGFDPAKKYPLLVAVHGGPAAVDWTILEYDRYYYYPVEQLAARGALILRPNYRGSAGYGEKFRSLNVRAFGAGDVADVLGGVDHLVRQGFVDPARVGAMGYSYGGTVCAFLSTTSDRFRAISVGAGVCDWKLYYATTDIPPFARQLFQATPWEDPDIYRKCAAITYVRAARTPTLIQHGERDSRVPVANAWELYRGLRDQGVPARLVLYKGAGHTVESPRTQRAMQEDNLRWFRRWLWDEKPADVGK
jgi:dipeptidyl aminopeptidase/acylaminoacyl peptidase